jgi:hypothetical protein
MIKQCRNVFLKMRIAPVQQYREIKYGMDLGHSNKVMVE